jgi:hypothetical protein
MLKPLNLVAVGAVALLCLSSAALAQFSATPDFTQGDAEKGKTVYQRTGVCANCHGWAGDGEAGRNPMVHVQGANLRESQLDAQGLYDVIRCGIPGTHMPYHDRVSYKDDRCNGLLMSDFDADTRPIMGKTFRDNQMLDLIAYLENYVVGRGEPTYEECALYFETSADKSCSYLKGE